MTRCIRSHTAASDCRPDLTKDSCESAFQQGIFVTSLMASFLLFLDNLLFSTKRWRQLRSGAGSLESLIWLYRARTGPFGQPNGPSCQSAEEIFQEKLDQWMDDLVSGADLSRTSLRRFKQTSKANKIYRHFQYEGALPSEAKDDHQTPVRPPPSQLDVEQGYMCLLCSFVSRVLSVCSFQPRLLRQHFCCRCGPMIISN